MQNQFFQSNPVTTNSNASRQTTSSAEARSQLSLDIWREIAAYLKPTHLKSLMQANQFFWKIGLSILPRYVQSMQQQLPRVFVSSFSSENIFLIIDGKVFGWGSNKGGKLGLGHKQPVQIPTLIPNLNNVVEIAIGDYHTVFLKKDGTVYVCGNRSLLGINESYEESLSYGSSVLVPKLVPLGVKMKSIASRDSHIVALTVDGKVYVWGDNRAGQLGLWDIEQIRIPTLLKALENVKVKQIVCGNKYVMAVTESGEVYVWGSNTLGQLGLGHDLPVSTPTRIPNLTGVKDVCCGNYFTMVLTTNHEVYAWGDNGNGLLGLRDTGQIWITTPTRVKALKNLKVKKIACGSNHAIVITEDGEVYVWGDNISGWLGLGENAGKYVLTPTRVPNFKGVREVACSLNMTAFMMRDGQIYVCGNNFGGKLGLDPKEGIIWTPRCLSLVNKVASSSKDCSGLMWLASQLQAGQNKTHSSTQQGPSSTSRPNL